MHNKKQTDTIKNRYNLKPVELIRGSVIEAIQTGKPWNEVLEVAGTMSNSQYIKNQKNGHM